MEFSQDVSLKGKIAEGGGGIVYKADLLNTDLIEKHGRDPVVVKVLKGNLSIPGIVISIIE